MEKSQIPFLSATELSGLIRAGEVSPVEAAQACLDRIEAVDVQLNSYITVSGDEALAQARQAEDDIAAGRYAGPSPGAPRPSRTGIPGDPQPGPAAAEPAGLQPGRQCRRGYSGLGEGEPAPVKTGEATGSLCLGTRSLVQEKVSNSLDRLACRKEEVKRRCRTVLQ